MSREDLELRLAKARSERSKLAQQREEKAVLAELEEQVIAEERALRDDQAVLAAIDEHGHVGQKIAVVETRLGSIVVKRSHHVLFRKFQDTAQTNTLALEKLVRPCLVYPDVSLFEQILEELPATLTRVADAVCVLAGVRKEDVTGK